MNPIRVLHFGLGVNVGGIETYLYQLTRHVDRSRLFFDFVYNDVGRPAFADDLRALGCELYPITPRRRSRTGNRRDLDSLMTEHDYDLVHCHLNTLSYVEPVWSALRHRHKVLVHSHSSSHPRSITTQLLHRLHSRPIRLGDVSKVAVSEAAGKWLFGADTPFSVLRNGIEAETFSFAPGARKQVRDSLGLEDAFLVGHVGAFREPKNHAFLIRVFNEVHRQSPNARLLLVGAGPLEGRIRLQAEAAGLGDQVMFLGARADVPALLSAMDCLVFPSKYEGLGLVVLEAQAAGLPAVISDAVPPEAIVAPTCTTLALTAPPSQWAERVLTHAGQVDRNQGPELLRSAGYAARDAAASVQSLYEDLVDS